MLEHRETLDRQVRMGPKACPDRLGGQDEADSGLGNDALLPHRHRS